VGRSVLVSQREEGLGRAEKSAYSANTVTLLVSSDVLTALRESPFAFSRALFGKGCGVFGARPKRAAFCAAAPEGVPPVCRRAASHHQRHARRVLGSLRTRWEPLT
jgi:hypothetical protein